MPEGHRRRRRAASWTAASTTAPSLQRPATRARTPPSPNARPDRNAPFKRGFFTAANNPFDPGWGVEVAYFFHPSTWGQGYASEMVAACMTVADHTLRLPEVRAFAHPANVGSRRVLEKAGFEELRFVPEMDRFLYRRHRQELRAVP